MSRGSERRGWTTGGRAAGSRSKILPPWARRSPKVTEVLPVLYLRGISTKDFVPALAEFFGSEAGLSPTAVQRLTVEWTRELEAFNRRDLSEVDHVYLWADGVHFNIRLEEDRLCCLVLVGVRADGRKELVAVSDGYRESEESWAEVLRDLKRKGMQAPVLAVGDGALGFWAAIREVFPETKEQRCWVHKIARVLDELPKSPQPKAKAALHEIMNAENKEAAEAAVDRFQEAYGAKYPKATEKLLKDRETLLAHFEYPPEHWLHLRTTNAIESTFATVRLRTKKTKGGAAGAPVWRWPQAAGARPGALALRQRAPPGRARARRRYLRGRRQGRPRGPQERRLTTPSPSMALSHHALRQPELPQPVRNASGLRPSSMTPSRVCQFCGNEYEDSSRPSSYCGAACRQRALRARRQQPVVPQMPRRALGLDVLYECTACAERLLNEQRCEGCCRFARRLGVAVTCPTCDEPIPLFELLELLP